MATALDPKWKLPTELCHLSDNLPWDLAVPQWRLDYIDHLAPGEDSATCLCHHHPIREICHIVNTQNAKTAIVGNCCIEKIGSQAFEKINNLFQAFKRIQQDPSKSANPPLIKYAFRKHIFSLKEAKRYRTIWRKKSDKNKTFKEELNRRLIDQIKTAREDIASTSDLKVYEDFEKTLEGPVGAAAAHETDEASEDEPSTRSEAPPRRHQSVARQAHTVATRSLIEDQSWLASNPRSLASKKLVIRAIDRGVIDGKSIEFYMQRLDYASRLRARPLSEAQQKWLDDLNKKILRLTPAQLA